MDFVKQYWWIILAALLVVIFISRKAAPQGATVQTIGPVDNSQELQLAVAGRTADEQNRVGLIGAFLGYLQGQDNLAASERINTANINAQVAIAQATGAANTANATAQYNAQVAAAAEAARVQNAAIAAANAQSSRNSWLQGITGGLGVFSGLLGNYGNSGSIFGSSPSYGTPGFNPNLGGGWGF